MIATKGKRRGAEKKRMELKCLRGGTVALERHGGGDKPEGSADFEELTIRLSNGRQTRVCALILFVAFVRL